jgi:DNA polymerase I-like protein with 3'-5' exonuclease and polymerase domains
MFKVRPGYKLVGCDASGLEARCLSHYLWRYDNGEYVEVVLHGDKALGTDVHGRNMKALGLAKPEAKRWFYAWMYGAGDDLLGAIAGGDKKLGAKLRKKFLKAMPAIARLIEAVQEKAKTMRVVRGLDGRTVPCRSQHSALNTVLQGAGAIIMKQALILCHDQLVAEGIDFRFVANIHDEFQMEVREDQAERAGQIARQSIIDAGEFFKFRCPLDGEYKIGNNWAETH